MTHPTWPNGLMVPIVLAGLALQSCVPANLLGADQPSPSPAITDSVTAANPLTNDELLQQSWDAYKQRFIQTDGRVIDRDDQDRTVSEGQAYAMLRAVMIDDPDTFDLTLRWAEKNLVREIIEGDRTDTLWAWKWGEDEQGTWGTLDENFASDADIDAATALIFAARRWNRPDYLELAQVKLQDIWDLSTVEVPSAESPEQATRYLLPGPASAFQPRPDVLYLNPSYLAPYAFRLFAQVDERDWLSLVDSSYEILNASSQLSPVGLPSDWVAFDTTTQEFYPIEEPRLQSVYGFDAYRVWWRVALDAAWFDEPRAIDYLRSHLDFLETEWRSQQMIPARLDLQGNPLVEYESTAQYGMLYAAFRVTDPAIADQIRTQKLLPTYRDGFWDNDSAYYTHNLSWFGIYSPNRVASTWLSP
ncbi:MAG: glycosyl hydrolase family 8 [Elainellaceae cyanobacterium]